MKTPTRTPPAPQLTPCRHCGREFQRGNNLTMHERACAKRPDTDTLRDMYMVQELTLAEMARRIDVTYRTVREWLVEDGICKYGGYKRRRGEKPDRRLIKSVAPIILRHDLAHPLAYKSQSKVHSGGRGQCQFCEGYDVCRETIVFGYICCEIPDERQVTGWVQAGLVPEKVTR